MLLSSTFLTQDSCRGGGTHEVIGGPHPHNAPEPVVVAQSFLYKHTVQPDATLALQGVSFPKNENRMLVPLRATLDDGPLRAPTIVVVTCFFEDLDEDGEKALFMKYLPDDPATRVSSGAVTSRAKADASGKIVAWQTQEGLEWRGVKGGDLRSCACLVGVDQADQKHGAVLLCEHMAKKLRKTFPKGLADLMNVAAESGDYSAVHSALEACEIDATDGAQKRTPLMLTECTPELASWVVERGTDVNALDRSGETALDACAGTRLERGLSPTDLIELGADVRAQAGAAKMTALHRAAGGCNVEAVKVLLAYGADVHAQNYDSLSALEYSLEYMSNVDLTPMVPVVAALIEGGAEVTPEAQESMRRASETFEFHRAGYNPDHVDAVSAAMYALCEQLDVVPVGARVVHDGTSPLVATSATWQEQHAELWELLVPSKGTCATVQGEVVRISGRLTDELNRNGGANWDDDYGSMAAAFIEHIASHTSLDAPSIDQANQVVRSFPRGSDAASELARLAVDWVILNPQPVPLTAAPYDR